MADLLLMGRQMMMLQKRFEMASRQGDLTVEADLLNQMKELGKAALHEDDSIERFVVYITAVKTIFTTYYDKGAFVEAGNVIFDALTELKPLFPYIHQERFATIVTQHLNFATLTVLAVIRKDMENNTLDEDQIRLTTGLADLLSQNTDNLRRIRPTNPLINLLTDFVQNLKSQGITGNSPCNINNMGEWVDQFNNLWFNVTTLS